MKAVVATAIKDTPVPSAASALAAVRAVMESKVPTPIIFAAVMAAVAVLGGWAQVAAAVLAARKKTELAELAELAEMASSTSNFLQMWGCKKCP